MVYKNRLLDSEIPSREKFNNNSVLYVLLIPSSEESTKFIDSSSFYYPKNFSKRSGVLIRVCTQNQSKEVKKFRIVRIKCPTHDVTIDELVQEAFKKLKETDTCSYKIYYHKEELAHDIRPLQDNCTIPIGKDIMPIIFDLVLTREEQVTQVPTTQNNPKIGGVEHKESSSTEYEPMTETFYLSYAYSVYISLRLHAQIYRPPLVNSKQTETESNSKLKGEQISDMLSNFYLFCDKDKSGLLDERERSVGLLTLLKYIDDGQNKLTADILLPIVYKQQTSNNEDDEYFCDENGFRTLIIDTLTEHLRIRTFGYPNCQTKPQLHEMSNEIDRISNAIDKTLKDHLNRNEECPSPFSLETILTHIGLFILCFIFLPIAVLYTILSNIPKNTHSLKSKIIIRQLIIILLSIIGALAACIVYWIIINIILYYIYYDDNTTWHVSALEAYWPFSLIFCIFFIAYLYGAPIVMHSDYQKNKQIEQFYREAELDMLKHKAEVIVLMHDKPSPMTMAEWESQPESQRHQLNKKHNQNNSSSTKTESSNPNKTNYWNKLIRIFIDIYESEKEKKSKLPLVLKIILFIFILGIVATHACMPKIYRTYSTNYTYPTNTTIPFQCQFIEISYIIVSPILYLIFILMIMYAYYLYNILNIELNRIIQQTANNNQYSIMQKNACYLDLRDPIKLDLFLAELRDVLHMNNKIEYRVRI